VIRKKRKLPVSKKKSLNREENSNVIWNGKKLPILRGPKKKGWQRAKKQPCFNPRSKVIQIPSEGVRKDSGENHKKGKSFRKRWRKKEKSHELCRKKPSSGH